MFFETSPKPFDFPFVKGLLLVVLTPAVTEQSYSLMPHRLSEALESLQVNLSLQIKIAVSFKHHSSKLRNQDSL
tara:strand:+ start:384 stop:605 length:222 start_codon:yes stop_codon:yes gene_type:complete